MACCGKKSIRYVRSSPPSYPTRRTPVAANYTYSSNPISSQPTSTHVHDYKISNTLTLSGKTYQVYVCSICGSKKVEQIQG